jgi:hypothetical protein
VELSPSLPNRTCGFPAYGSPPELPFRARTPSPGVSVVLRTASPKQPLFSRLLSGDRFGKDTPRTLADDPIRRTPAPSFGEPNVDEGHARCRPLARRRCASHSWLRSLRCSRLSPGVYATMNCSDSSQAPPPSALPLWRRFRQGYRTLPEPTRSPSVTHVSVPSILTPTTRRVPVRGFTFLGRLAHPSRRIAFTFVSGWSLTRVLHRRSRDRAATVVYGGYCPCTGSSGGT